MPTSDRAAADGPPNQETAVRSAAAPSARLLLPAAALAVCLGAGGCNILGAISILNYQFVDPWIPEDEVPAEFTLPAGRTAVLVQADPEIEVDAPQLGDMITKRTLAELEKNLPMHDFVGFDEVRKLRHKVSRRFSRMSPREIGNRLRADTVVRVQLKDFRNGVAEEGDFRLSLGEVLVQVIDCRDGSVIWPEADPYHSIPVAGGRFNPAAENQDLLKANGIIADQVAERVSKLFYDWRPPKRDIGDGPR
jgi:hypothetical protein